MWDSLKKSSAQLLYGELLEAVSGSIRDGGRDKGAPVLSDLMRQSLKKWRNSRWWSWGRGAWANPPSPYSSCPGISWRSTTPPSRISTERWVQFSLIDTDSSGRYIQLLYISWRNTTPPLRISTERWVQFSLIETDSSGRYLHFMEKYDPTIEDFYRKVSSVFANRYR